MNQERIEELNLILDRQFPPGVSDDRAMAILALEQIDATREQTAAIRAIDADRRRADALTVGMKVLLQNNNAHQAAMEHLFRMVGGLLNAAQQIPGFAKSPESVRAAFDAAERFCKQGGQNFGPLFGRVLNEQAYNTLSAEEKATVDGQFAELVTYVEARLPK